MTKTAHPRTADTLRRLRALGRPDQLAAMTRFGLVGVGRLGVAIPELRRLAKAIGSDHALALALWDSAIPDAQILAGLVAEPRRLTSRQMDRWVRGIGAWDVCDGACLNCFRFHPLAWDKVAVWAERKAEFVRRCAFALLAVLAVHDKASADQRFIDALALIERHAGDERNFVKKAANWALRQIGKRNPQLRRAAIACAQRLRQQGSRSARWIAADALRELQRPGKTAAAQGR
jgi:3-methyladenine DNA glycosylase AlkD